jgi:hypothetical protein
MFDIVDWMQIVKDIYISELDFSEHDNDPSVFVKGREFLYW